MLKNPLYKYGPRNVEIPANIHFGEFVLEKLRSYDDREAFINASTGESRTYKHIAQEAINFAISLTRMGVRKGQTIAICTENRLEFWPAAVGIMCAGAVLTTINSSYSYDEMKHVLNIAKPCYIICSPLTYKIHKKLLKTIAFLKTIILFGNQLEQSTVLFGNLISGNINPEQFLCTDVQGQTDTAMILYSSGTTGLPKGVMLTHYNLLLVCNMTGKNPDLPITILTVTPWYHVTGLIGTLNSMVSGRKIVYLPKFEEKLYLETIQRYRVHIITLVPPIAVILAKSKLLNNYDVSSVLQIYSGAAPLDAGTVKEVKERFPNVQAFLQAYGMTESAFAVTLDADTAPKPGSVGPVVGSGCILKVVDIETRKPLGPNISGEICIKGPILMKGYVGRSKSDDFDEDGFYKSGDIGYYDTEGYFFIVDRLKEIIKYKGFQVPPAEIEAVLLQHKDVIDSGVIGIPDKAAGELPLAFIVKRPGSEVTAGEIQAFVASKLSNPKHLRGGVRFLEAIPKNPSGKILRRELKKLFNNNKSKL